MIAIHDQQAGSHDYLRIMYFHPLFQYLYANGHDVKLITQLDQAKDCIVLTDTDFLTPEAVTKLKNNGCKVIGFNMVDSSVISQHCSEFWEVDHIFSLTGIQKTNVGREFVIDKEFNVSLEDRKFIPDEQWRHFNMMRLTGRLHSLPYVHWEWLPAINTEPYDRRSQRVLIRGGAHFRRVVLALFLLKLNRLDCNSAFPLHDFFKPEMAEQFRFCQPCQRDFQQDGKYCHRAPLEREVQCTSPAQWGGELDLENMGQWNNRCPQSFYWLAEKFKARYGDIPSSDLETLFNGKFVDTQTHLSILGRMALTADLKWLHSIYAPQRFWDGAYAGAVNLLPSRTNDQEYFPHIEEGEHYITFQENFQSLEEEAQISKERYEHISANTRSLYEQWIKPTDYAINTNLLKHIVNKIL